MDRGGKRLELSGLVGEVERCLQPAESRRDCALDEVLAGPHRRVAHADRPVGPFLVDGPVAGNVERRLQRRVAEREIQGKFLHSTPLGWRGVVPARLDPIQR